MVEDDLVKIVQESLVHDPKTIRLVMKNLRELPVEVVNVARNCKIERFVFYPNIILSC